MNIEVAGIQIAVASRLPMKNVPSAEVLDGRGIAGDRYERHKRRQVSVQSLEEIAEAETEFGAEIDPVLTRRNITLSAGQLNRSRGSRITIGTVELEVVLDAAPCKLLEDAYGPGAMQALRKRAGVHCHVLTGGTITLGDAARVL